MTNYTFPILAVLAFALASPIVNADNPAQSSDATDRITHNRLQIGRYTMSVFNDRLVMLDTATGSTWTLQPATDSHELSWTPIKNAYSIQSRMVAAVKSATEGRVDVQTFPEHDIIVLRGAKEDVEAAKSAARRVEQTDDKPSEN